jgi:hypothetical protein
VPYAPSGEPLRKPTQFEVIPVEEVLRIAVPLGKDEVAEVPPDRNYEPVPNPTCKVSEVPDE